MSVLKFLARQKTQASFALALRNAAPSFRTEICSK